MTRRKRTRSVPIDWEEVRSRLSRAAAALEGTFERSPEDRRKVMDERARVLAQLPPPQQRAEEFIEIVTLVLGTERYALETRLVREIARLDDFTPVPGAPDFVLGVVNLRGEVLAVMDLRRFFGVPVKGLTDLSRVAVLGEARGELGVLADEAQAVTTLRADEVLEPPGSVAGIGRDYLRGVTADALIILDGAVLLADGRMYVNQAQGGVE